MKALTLASRYLHTVRHLRFGQIFHRIRFRLSTGRRDFSPAPALRSVTGPWVYPVERPPSMKGPMRFRFLNEEQPLAGWDDSERPKLWRYNLHYFDDLCAEGAETRRSWHQEIIMRWIADNPAFSGSGWEPYPCSLRIVNWIKYALSGNTLTKAAQHSLAVQTRWLASRIEWHILGNHLLANAKALIFAGSYFSGPESDCWRALGLSILARELPEQILKDGGHFERSPMYHALVLEDVLDLINVTRAYDLDRLPSSSGGSRIGAEFEGYATRMRLWLAQMCHPDGEIAFFNDASFRIGARPSQLDDYAQRLGQSPLETQRDALVDLSESGYIRLADETVTLLVDAAPVGPDYLPAHGHADTLSFEMSIGAQRFVVNGGTSLYGNSHERQRQRGTAAHNTVEIDGMDSSEVWHGFRVARRARVIERIVEHAGTALTVRAVHDGYLRLPGKPLHRRCWTLEGASLLIDDSIVGDFNFAVAYFHFHPNVVIRVDSGKIEALMPDGTEVAISPSSRFIAIEDGTWHPEFGVSVDNKRLVIRFDGTNLRTRMTWMQ